jgi:hypothetical protein
MGKKESAIMMCEIFDRVLAEALKQDGHVELRLALPIHVASQYTWSARIPGRGVYMGRAYGCYGEDGEQAIAFEHPDTFIPEE